MTGRGGSDTRWLGLAAGGCLVVLATTTPRAADVSNAYGRPMAAPLYDDPNGADLPPLPRFFPREGGETNPPVIVNPRMPSRQCRPRRVPVPTGLPDDPSYVGSAYGLGKPSAYGFTPPLGVDDPFGRSVLPYCR